MGRVTGIAILVTLLLGISSPIGLLGQSVAIAAPICRTNPDHDICILSIKRSAKYHWQYQAAVKIDHQIRPIERYNCRLRVRTDKDGNTVPFEPNGAGELICTLLKR